MVILRNAELGGIYIWQLKQAKAVNILLLILKIDTNKRERERYTEDRNFNRGFNRSDEEWGTGCIHEHITNGRKGRGS